LILHDHTCHPVYQCRVARFSEEVACGAVLSGFFSSSSSSSKHLGRKGTAKHSGSPEQPTRRRSARRAQRWRGWEERKTFYPNAVSGFVQGALWSAWPGSPRCSSPVVLCKRRALLQQRVVFEIPPQCIADKAILSGIQNCANAIGKPGAPAADHAVFFL
jgi:hypothetical protein